MLDVGGIPLVQTGNSGGDGLGFGGGAGILGIILIIALLGGNGFGGLGGNKNGAGVAAVDNTVWEAQNFSRLEAGHNAIQNQLTGIGNGICESTYALNNAVKDGNYATALALQTGFTNIGNGICNSTFATTAAITALGTQLQSCCCDINRNIDSVNFNIERSNNAVIQAGNANTQRIVDIMSCRELNDKNQQIFEMSQRAQTLELMASQKPQAPIPSYTVQSPYAQYQNVACC